LKKIIFEIRTAYFIEITKSKLRLYVNYINSKWSYVCKKKMLPNKDFNVNFPYMYIVVVFMNFVYRSLDYMLTILIVNILHTCLLLVLLISKLPGVQEVMRKEGTGCNIMF
jgi:hypothetical protein